MKFICSLYMGDISTHYRGMCSMTHFFFLSIFVLECFIMPNRIFNFFFYVVLLNIHIYNLFYICTGTHACMGFVPDNKLIRIRITMLLSLYNDYIGNIILHIMWNILIFNHV